MLRTYRFGRNRIDCSWEGSRHARDAYVATRTQRALRALIEVYLEADDQPLADGAWSAEGRNVVQ